MYGLAAHPGDSYYDPTRPGWLPYWIDTPTEEALKFGMYPGVTMQQINNPDSVYTPMNPPPMPASTLPSGAAIPAVPESGVAAQSTVDALLAKQLADWKAQNVVDFTAIDAQVNPPPAASGIPWWWWLVGGLGAFGLVALGGGSSRRYGR